MTSPIMLEHRFVQIILLFSLISAFSMCRKPEPVLDEEFDERLSGGTQTTFDGTSGAFSSVFEGLSGNDLRVHDLGDLAFEQTFVTAPSTHSGGLGPAFNNVSCISCHHNDGKGTPTAGEAQSSLLMRISYPGKGSHGENLPCPGYGTQIQDKSVFGKVPEAKINMTYTGQPFTFPDGETIQLYYPLYSMSNLSAPISGSYELSPRLAPPIFGLGLLEALSETTLLSFSDESDINGDGISGRPNYVWDNYTQQTLIGRFGLKANTATILTQVAAAYNNDIGITSYVFPHETNAGQSQHDNLNDDPELPDSILNAVKFYIQTLQVPARRNVTNEKVIRGKSLFASANCSGCHIPTIKTGVNVAFPQVSNQTIHPYTDLLLHDMGPGLADNRPDFRADGNEWRTAPLWGLGLIATVNYPGYYLHDGRAQTITEAILWHGGEAEASKNYFIQMSKEDRDALLAFLRSL